MNSVKFLYRLIPAIFRDKINYLRFQDLRQAGYINILRKAGILTCINNIQVGIDNAEEVLKNYDANLKSHNIVEENKYRNQEK